MQTRAPMRRFASASSGLCVASAMKPLSPATQEDNFPFNKIHAQTLSSLSMGIYPTGDCSLPRIMLEPPLSLYAFPISGYRLDEQ